MVADQNRLIVPVGGSSRRQRSPLDVSLETCAPGDLRPIKELSMLISPAHPHRYRRFADTFTSAAARLAEKRGWLVLRFSRLSLPISCQLAWRTVPPPNTFTMWLAGGGTKPGITVGRTDELGFNIVEDPVHMHDMHATILHLLGLDHTRLVYKFQSHRSGGFPTPASPLSFLRNEEGGTDSPPSYRQRRSSLRLASSPQPEWLSATRPSSSTRMENGTNTSSPAKIFFRSPCSSR